MRSSTSSSSPGSVGRVWSWSAALLFGLGFALSIEVATRVDQAIQYGAPLLGIYTYDSALFEYDEYGVRGRPGGVYEKWRMNALGLRGPEASLVPAGDRLRVITLGASETFGIYESAGAEWPRALERELGERGVRAEVLNGAMAGATPAIQLQHLRHRLLSLAPDLVVWVAHYSSFAGLDPARLERSASARPEPPERPGWLAGLAPRIPGRLREAVFPRLPEIVRNQVEVLRKLQLARLQSNMGDSFGSLTQVSEDERASFEYFISSASEAAGSVGASLVVVLPPRRLDERSLRLQSLSFPYVSRSWMEEAIETFAASAADAAVGDVPPVVVDQRGIFGIEADEFMMDTVHFNDAGALAFAHGIAPFIRANPDRLDKTNRRRDDAHPHFEGTP